MDWVQDFLKNNRGINDGADLPEAYMLEIYDRIINDEIKMKVRVCLNCATTSVLAMPAE